MLAHIRTSLSLSRSIVRTPEVTTNLRPAKQNVLSAPLARTVLTGATLLPRALQDISLWELLSIVISAQPDMLVPI